MENKINIAELLKDCPKGMELDCTIFDGTVILESINIGKDFPINIRLSNGNLDCLTEIGGVIHEDLAKCVIFPKGKTTWEGFIPPSKFKDGDVISVTLDDNLWICIYKNVNCKKLYCHVSYSIGTNTVYSNSDGGLCYLNSIINMRLATKEEKQKLFDAIKNNGYKWNAETKTLEESVKPIFKRGDTIRSKKKRDENFYILSVDEDSYMIDIKNLCIKFKDQDNFELASAKFDINTLKPFKSEVLIRDTNRQAWTGAFYSHYDVKDDYPYHCINFGRYKQCIPYEGNEHLLGKTNDCDDYYKTWK